MIKTNVFKKFIEPINANLKNNPFGRNCIDLTDEDFFALGLYRVIGEDKSGRAFLQRARMEEFTSIDNSHFFKTLKSKRRLKLLKRASNDFIASLNLLLAYKDIFKKFPELDGFDIYASDGSYHEWACHDPRYVKKSKSGPEEIKCSILPEKRVEVHKASKRSCQHFFSFNLRTHSANHLTVAIIGGERQKEHDMHALKRLEHIELRLNALKGRKVLHVYDRAGLDFMQWEKWKQSSGIYFLSREKENSRLSVVGTPPFNTKDPINAGVISDEMVGTGNGYSFRRVTYKCPETGETFSFLTNLPQSIRPGLVVFLYLARWNIEKLFDVFKNKLEEKKAWASSDTAKTIQALFLCLAQNLTLLMNNKIELEEGLKYKYDLERKLKALKLRQENLEEKKIMYPNTWELGLTVSQLTIKFYRWLRLYFRLDASWEVAIVKLRALYEEN